VEAIQYLQKKQKRLQTV